MSYIPVRLPSEEEMKSCQRIQMTSEEEWRPYSTSWAENEEGVEEVDPSVPFKSEPVEETTSLNVREVDQVTGSFRGFRRIVMSAVAVASLWQELFTAWSRTLDPFTATERYGVDHNHTSSHYREIFGVRVAGDYSPAVVPEGTKRKAESLGSLYRGYVRVINAVTFEIKPVTSQLHQS